MKRSLASTVPLKLNKDLVFQVFKFSFLQVTVSERGKNFSIFLLHIAESVSSTKYKKNLLHFYFLLKVIPQKHFN